MIGFWIFAILALAGTILMTALALRALAHFRTSRPFGNCPREAGDSPRGGSSPSGPRVSILKPLCGLDDGLEANLLSFARLEGVSYELIGSVDREDDPAAEVFRRVMRKCPEAPFLLVAGGARGGLNPKIRSLIPALARATGDIVFVSDSNVRCRPEALVQTLEPILRGEADAVSNPFVGSGSTDLGSIVESLHLLGFVVPGNLLAEWTKRPCLVGKSFAVRREALERIGGFDRFRNVLAEDQAIAIALSREGLRSAYSPVIVENVIEKRTVGRALARQIRWGKIRISFSASLYAGEFLMNPLPLALLAALTGLLSGLPGSLALLLPLVVAGARIGQAFVLDGATEGRLPRRAFWLVPLADLLQFGTQFVPFFSRSVNWNGHKARLGPGTLMLPLEPSVSGG